MTLTSLRIRQIDAARFGRLVGRTLTVPDTSFVVVAGANESGKSTFAELLAWLLVGPNAGAVDAQRFGDVEDKVQGRLSAVLGDQPVTMDGSFRIPKRGAIADRDLRVDQGGPVTLEAWRARLGGVDPAVFQAVYRLWGQELHEGADVEKHLSTVALAGLVGGVDPRDLASGWDDAIKGFTTKRAEGAESILRLDRDIDALDREIAAAGRNAAEHERVVAEIARLAAEREALVSERTARERERVVLDTVRAVSARRREAAELQHRVNALGEIPLAWLPLALDPDAVISAIGARAQAHDRVGAARQVTRLDADRYGCTPERLSAVSVTDADLTEITARVTALAAAREAEAAARRELASAEASLAEASSAADRAVAVTEIPRSDIAVTAIDPAAHAAFIGAIDTWAEAGRLVAERAARVDEARTARAGCDQQLAHARAAWERRETGMSAEQWLHHRPAAPAPAGGPGRLPALIGLGGTVIVALASVLARAWVPAAIAVIVAVVLGVLVVRARAVVPAAVVDPAALDDAVAAANEVMGASARLAQADTTLQQAQAGVDGATASERRAHQAVSDLFRQVRLPAPDHPDAARVRLDTWVRAVDALGREATARDAVTAATARVAHLAGVATTADDGVRSLLERCGLDGLVSPATPPEQVLAARQAGANAREADRLVGELTRCDEVLQALLAPVADEIAGWSDQRLVEHVTALAVRQRERAQLIDALARLSADIDAALGDDPATRSLADEGVDEVELQARIAAVDDELARLAAEHDALSEQIGRRGTERDQLASVEQLADLRERRGAVRERAEELATRAAAHAVARALLLAEADEYERAHQPAIVLRASELVREVAPLWDHISVRPASADQPLAVLVRQHDRGLIPASRLSTGARALLYLAFRVALAEHDAQRRGVRLPFLCDDPLVHLDDERARQVVPVLRAAADSGHQVLLFTCHERTVEVAREAGASLVRIAD